MTITAGIVNEVSLISHIRAVSVVSEYLGGKTAGVTREVVHEVSERRKYHVVIFIHSIRKGEDSTRVNRNKLLCTLHHYVKAGSNSVITGRMRDGVLKLVVIEDPTLWKRGIRTNASHVRCGATEKNLRRRGQQFGIAIVEEHVEATI